MELEDKINSETFEDLGYRINALRCSLACLASWDPDDEICKKMNREKDYIQALSRSFVGISVHGELEAQLGEIKQIIENLVVEKGAGVKLKESFDEASLNSERQPASEQVQAVAAFIHPTDTHMPQKEDSSRMQRQFENEDSIRIQAANLQLVEQLAQFPQITVPGTNTSLFINSFRSWTSEDDDRAEAAAEARREAIVLELSEGAAAVMEIQTLLGQQVENQSDPLAQTAQRVEETLENTGNAVDLLRSSNDNHRRFVERLWTTAILGVGTVAIGGAVGTGCVACIVGRGAITATAFSVNRYVNNSQTRWQQMAIEKLPRDFIPLRETTKKRLESVGDEAERRLLRKLVNNGDSWRSWYSLRSIGKGYLPYYRQSDLHNRSAWMTSWKVKIPALKVFRMLQKISLTGSLDPNCGVIWSRPVERSPENNTFVRYTVFSSFMNQVCRDFLCISRCKKTESDDGCERYMFVAMSLPPEFLEDCGLPENTEGIEHGTIHVSGVLVTECDESTSEIAVMADCDISLPNAAQLFLPGVQDKLLRKHVVDMASNLNSQLKLG